MVLKLYDPNVERCKFWFRIYWTANYYGNVPELTTLMIISYFEFRRAANLLLEKGADANIQAENGVGWTALHWAAEDGHEAVVNVLLEKGADANIQTEDGDERTALHYAIERGHEAVSKVLRN